MSPNPEESPAPELPASPAPAPGNSVYTKGDVDNSGKVNLKDAQLILKCALKLIDHL